MPGAAQQPPPPTGAALPTVSAVGSAPPPELSHWTVDEVEKLNGLQGQFSNLRVRKLIDEGASSQVWEGEWAGARVVVKVLREHEALRSFLSEVNWSRSDFTQSYWLWPVPSSQRTAGSCCVCTQILAAQKLTFGERRVRSTGKYLAAAAPPVCVRFAGRMHFRWAAEHGPRVYDGRVPARLAA